MAYRNKTYVCFDADTDIIYYNLMKAWKENGKIAFDFNDAHDLNNLRDSSSEEQIKKKLRERLKNTKVLIVLIGENTKKLYKYVRWEIEVAIELEISIVVANLNKKRKIDFELCPKILKDTLAVHVGFGQNIINYALNHWPKHHEDLSSKGVSGPHSYSDKIYD